MSVTVQETVASTQRTQLWSSNVYYLGLPEPLGV
ncbi:rCG55401 [Rattus norvegicus]|uniref:RCG55401 n=1 Tax=Rattus norvegicus TaxID=10116 RepID=A6JQE6_RAT|nr:rCG55401 [Rattus norvegicus]